MTFRQLKALWTMGAALLRKLLLMPFVRSPGSGPWLGRIREERLAPTPARAWDRFAAAGRCIGCGLCQTVAPRDFSPCASILGAGRRPEDAPLAVAEAEVLRRIAGDIARICPARVGVEELSTLILDNARLLEGQ
jgi:ferredoxin